MRIAALACLAFLAPERTYELRYRFEKGLVYEDVQERTWELILTEEGRRYVHQQVRSIHVKRSVLESDETSHPVAERVEVKKFRLDIIAWPQQDRQGVQPDPSEGKTFFWRRLKQRWGLFDESAAEVTDKYAMLVDYLKNWRDARLPKEHQPVGGSWEVSPKRFLQTAGMPVPKSVKGVALFKLEKVEAGAASIVFDFRYQFGDGKAAYDVKQKGVWGFDVDKGRDLSFKMEGEVLVDKGKRGKGKMSLTRRVTYSS